LTVTTGEPRSSRALRDAGMEVIYINMKMTIKGQVGGPAKARKQPIPASSSLASRIR